MHHSLKYIAFFTLSISALLLANPNYYFNIGMSKPFAPDEFQEDWRSGFNIGLGVGYNLSPKFEIQGEFLYDNFQLDDTSFLNDITDANDYYTSVSGGAASLVGLYANAKYLAPLQKTSALLPYLIASLGVASKNIGAMDVTTAEEMYTIPKESQTTLGAGVGIGVEILMGRRTFFIVEGRFNALLTEETTVYFPLKLGIVIR